MNCAHKLFNAKFFAVNEMDESILLIWQWIICGCTKTNTVKPVLSGLSKIDKTQILMTNGSLMKVESIAECSHWSILQYFWPALSDNLSENPIFRLFLVVA